MLPPLWSIKCSLSDQRQIVIVGPCFDRNFGRRIRIVLLDVEVDREMGDAGTTGELDVDQMRLVPIGLPEFREVCGA